MIINPPLCLEQVANMLEAKFCGDPNLLISGINEINVVNTGDLTFVDHPKYYTKALKSKASVVIINYGINCPQNKGLIFSEDPFRDFVGLIKHFSPFKPASQLISQSACIGKGTIIQPGTFVGNNVVIGKNCIIHPNVTIYDNCLIGDKVIIHAGTVIGSDGLYFKRRPTHYDKLESGGRVVIGNNVEIGANCTIDKGVTSDTILGSGTKLDNQIHVAHDTVIGKNCLIAAQVAIAGCAVIEDDVIIWGQVAIQKCTVIGKGAVLLARSGNTKSLEGNKTYLGAPAIEARRAWKEMAAYKKLPELIEKLEKKT